MICAIVGSTKIAEVHLTELIKNGAKEIVLISRSKEKRINIIKKYKKNCKKKINLSDSSIKILAKKKFDVICICSATNIHDFHLKIISGLKSLLIIEKPIISLLKIKSNYKNYLKKFYKKNKRVVVCYPMTHLANQVLKFSKIYKKINTCEFNFKTRGYAKYKEICVDLMPHALTFLRQLFKDKNFLKKKFFIKYILVKKNLWECKFLLKNLEIKINLQENMPKTLLEIKLNNTNISRKTKYNNKNFINYLVNNKTYQKKIIKNPMSEFYKTTFKNLKNRKYFKMNKDLTFDLMKKNYTFLK